SWRRRAERPRRDAPRHAEALSDGYASRPPSGAWRGGSWAGCALRIGEDSMTLRGLLLALLIPLGPGCAKTDWIGGTPVTVCVSGTWRGSASPRQGVQAEVEMTLRQNGPKVTGEGRFRTTKVSIEGTVRGDGFS